MQGSLLRDGQRGKGVAQFLRIGDTIVILPLAVGVFYIERG